MSTPITIRAAQPGDISAMAALLTELNRAEGFDMPSEPDELARALFAPEREVRCGVLLALVDAQAVGLVFYYPGYDTLTKSDGFHLADIVVTESHRRQGIGRRLFVALGAQALAEKKQWMSLTVLRENVAARGFYASLGMTQVGVDFFAIGERGLANAINAN